MGMKTPIWNNDKDALFATLVAQNIEAHLSEEEIWDEVFERIEGSLEDVVNDLNISTFGLVVVGKIAKAYGKQSVNKPLRSRNLGAGILEVIRLFGGGENDLKVYAEDGHLFIEQMSKYQTARIEIREGGPSGSEPTGQYAERLYRTDAVMAS